MNWRSMGRLSLILALCLSAAACGSLLAKYGRIDPDNGVTKAFEGYRVDGALRYYVSGALHYPNALIGLQRDYRLDPGTLWREVPEMTAAKMKEIVESMRTKASQHSMFQYGFALSDDKGRPVGVWYSVLWARTFLRMNEDGTVRIDTPDLDVYQKSHGDSVVDQSSN